MSGDGAAMGVGAERALKTILGGQPQPDEEEMESVEAMRNRLLTMTKPEEWSYGSAADWCAALILRYFLADPRRASIPTEAEYDWEGDPDRGTQGTKPEFTRSIGLYETMKRDGHAEELEDLGLTGFQWGWAVNAARRCVELGPVPNPAILSIEP